MSKTVAIGLQSFDKLREGKCFYIDKTFPISGLACVLKQIAEKQGAPAEAAE